MRAPLLILALLAVAGSAAAGEARLDLPADPLPPRGEALAGALHLDLECESLPSSGTETLAILVEESPSWAVVELTPTTLPAARAACVDGVWSGRSEVAIQATHDAPALKPVPLRVAVVRADGTKLVASDTFSAGYLGRATVTAADAQRTAPAGSPVAFALTADNFGNGLTRLSFQVAEAPEGWNVVVPPSLTLESRPEGGEHPQVPFALGVAIPEGASGAYTIRLAYTVAHALKPALTGEGGALVLTVNATERSVPSAGLLAGLCGLVAIALLRRRAA